MKHIFCAQVMSNIKLNLFRADRRSKRRRRVFAVEELDALVVQVAAGIAVGIDGLLPADVALQRRIR